MQEGVCINLWAELLGLVLGGGAMYISYYPDQIIGDSPYNVPKGWITLLVSTIVFGIGTGIFTGPHCFQVSKTLEGLACVRILNPAEVRKGKGFVACMIYDFRRYILTPDATNTLCAVCCFAFLISEGRFFYGLVCGVCAGLSIVSVLVFIVLPGEKQVNDSHIIHAVDTVHAVDETSTRETFTRESEIKIHIHSTPYQNVSHVIIYKRIFNTLKDWDFRLYSLYYSWSKSYYIFILFYWFAYAYDHLEVNVIVRHGIPCIGVFFLLSSLGNYLLSYWDKYESYLGAAMFATISASTSTLGACLVLPSTPSVYSILVVGIALGSYGGYRGAMGACLNASLDQLHDMKKRRDNVYCMYLLWILPMIIVCVLLVTFMGVNAATDMDERSVAGAMSIAHAISVVGGSGKYATSYKLTKARHEVILAELRKRYTPQPEEETPKPHNHTQRVYSPIYLHTVDMSTLSSSLSPVTPRRRGAEGGDRFAFDAQERLVGGYRVTVVAKPLRPFIPTLHHYRLIDMHPNVIYREGQLIIEPKRHGTPTARGKLDLRRLVMTNQQSDIRRGSSISVASRFNMPRPRGRSSIVSMDSSMGGGSPVSPTRSAGLSLNLPLFKSTSLYIYGFAEQEAMTRLAAMHVERMSSRHNERGGGSPLPSIEDGSPIPPPPITTGHHPIPSHLPPITAHPYNFHCHLFMLDHTNIIHHHIQRLGSDVEV
eukprot:GHVO01016486.1.p1 GENE.GHVO01016486.1~~GHVO01016486.1.p1  ORF type:complete len:786 (+),score=99.19 GHVO01016486.1:230-2359(+)